MTLQKVMISFLLASFGIASAAFGEYVKGIFLTQYTLENSQKLSYLINRAKATGINTFVVDLYTPRRQYQQNIKRLKAQNIRYVTRIVVFPYGGTAEQVLSRQYWEKKYQLVQTAVQYGADEIQLDYIRYSAKNKPSPQNAKDIRNVLTWFKERLAKLKVPLQIDVFGEVAFHSSPAIGQDLPVFAGTIDAVCPMLYPSHFEPYQQHAQQPYKTVHSAIEALYGQFAGNPPFKVYPYIEMYNYRVLFSRAQRREYVKAQIKAVEDSQADGWFAWSAGNKYELLFDILEEAQGKDQSISQSE